MEIEQVYREVAPKLQSYLTGNGCSYATACDIVQETFLRLWKRKDELSDDLHQVSGLAFTIARNYRNDLARKTQHEVFGEKDEGETEERIESCAVRDAARPGEAEEEGAALRRRLKSSLARMPVELLETFALSRLGKLTVKDIASGTGASEANVKVRVHRAKEMLGKVMKCGNMEIWKCGNGEMRKCGDEGNGEFGWAVFRAVMMLAAVDGEIAKEELSLYRELAGEFREGNAVDFDAFWAESVKGMAYIGFLSEMLMPEELVREFVREAGKGLGADGIAVLERMAAADGDYSQIERDCISALSCGIAVP